MEFGEIWTWVSGHTDANVVAASASALSALAAFFSASAAFKTIERNDLNHAKTIENAEQIRLVQEAVAAKRLENERLLQHAATTLERSFAALRGRDVNALIPSGGRVGWLTAARLIESYHATKPRIDDPLLLAECESHEDHWRSQFYSLLAPLAQGCPDYFNQADTTTCIQALSAVIVHAFADWPNDKEDPLHAYGPMRDAIEQMHVHLKWSNLRRCLGIL